jgi:hypothetical protein
MKDLKVGIEATQTNRKPSEMTNTARKNTLEGISQK